MLRIKLDYIGLKQTSQHYINFHATFHVGLFAILTDSKSIQINKILIKKIHKAEPIYLFAKHFLLNYFYILKCDLFGLLTLFQPTVSLYN